MLEQKERLHLDKYTEIHAIKKDDEDHSYYINRSSTPRKYINESAYPTRQVIEEYLTYLILQNNRKTKRIAKFLSQLDEESKNPLHASKETLQEILLTDHPEIVERVQKYTKEQLLEAGVQIALSILKENPTSTAYARLYFEITLHANKEGGSRIRFQNGRYFYEEQNYNSAPDQNFEFPTMKDAGQYLINHDYLGYTDGRLTGKVAQRIIYNLERYYKDIHSVRQYLDRG